jgi:hypothetical protein
MKTIAMAHQNDRAGKLTIKGVSPLNLDRPMAKEKERERIGKVPIKK